MVYDTVLNSNLTKCTNIIASLPYIIILLFISLGSLLLSLIAVHELAADLAALGLHEFLLSRYW